MLSRHADACYWIGRCVERAEATARMLDVHYHAALESVLPSKVIVEEDDSSSLSWQAVLAVSGTASAFAEHYDAPSDRNVLRFFAFDTENSNSIFSLWRAARENARSVRDLIASEMWESLNISYMQLWEWNGDRIAREGPSQFFSLVKNASHLFQGIQNRTQMLGETRDWLDAGRFLERGGQTARLLDIKYFQLLPATHAEESDTVPLEAYGVGGALDIHGWLAVLRSVSANEMFRKAHQDGFRPASVVDFLVLDPHFPASVRYCLGRVDEALRRISSNVRDEPANEPERLVGKLKADLMYTRAEEVILDGLHSFLMEVQRRFAEIGNAVTRTYLSY